MLSIMLDTGLVAIPNFGTTDEIARTLIERAFAFSSAIADGLHSHFIISQNAESVLWSCGCGPDHDTIDDFLEIFGLSQIFSTNDIVMAYQTIFGRASRPDQYAIPETNSLTHFVCEPPLPEDLGPVELKHQTQRDLATAALAGQVGLVRVFVPGWHSLSDAAQVAATIDSLIDSQGSIATPVHVNDLVEYLALPTMLPSKGLAPKIWATARNADDLHLAIAIRALELMGAARQSDGHVQHFSVGSDFLASLKANQCAGDGPFSNATLDLCAHIVAGMCNRRIGPMGRPQQETRPHDAALAWRVHLTDSHQALRLHYWANDNGIEFANVGPKMELTISAGHPGHTHTTEVGSLLS